MDSEKINRNYINKNNYEILKKKININSWTNIKLLNFTQSLFKCKVQYLIYANKLIIEILLLNFIIKLVSIIIIIII